MSAALVDGSVVVIVPAKRSSSFVLSSSGARSRSRRAVHTRSASLYSSLAAAACAWVQNAHWF
jgi:hypothetical protein